MANVYSDEMLDGITDEDIKATTEDIRKRRKALVNANNVISEEEADLIGAIKQYNCNRIIELLDDLEGLGADEFNELTDFLIKIKEGRI